LGVARIWAALRRDPPNVKGAADVRDGPLGGHSLGAEVPPDNPNSLKMGQSPQSMCADREPVSLSAQSARSRGRGPAT